MRKNWHSFVKSHNLINRLFDMLDYFNFFDNLDNVELVKKEMKKKIQSLYYVESLAKYFDDRIKDNINNIEVRCNLSDLIIDLDYLKQYLTKK